MFSFDLPRSPGSGAHRAEAVESAPPTIQAVLMESLRPRYALMFAA
jgi:hypothetical protein